eukprot:TRINITY_DN990_c0_g2_i1.p1 TRINITY_DN990_c0_g2~~TRINITY_DN990_c0_g2_i1.p1  ORF type:complete len:574 (-),score=191.20 TRINITY_DN990_c0_g2_i1:23-1744(-)
MSNTDNRSTKKLKIDLSNVNINLNEKATNVNNKETISEITSTEDKQLKNSLAKPTKFETEVRGEDYVKIILQFLSENGLNKSFQALSEETEIKLNTVDNTDLFLENVKKGNWDKVLAQVNKLHLSFGVLCDLYEQVFYELLELREVEIARMLLRQTRVLQILKEEQSQRYLKLERAAQRNLIDIREIWANGKKASRKNLAAALKKELSVVQPSRLVVLVGQALYWQKFTGRLPYGSSFDIFEGTAPPPKKEKETYVTKSSKKISLGKKSHATCLCFAPSGDFIASGSSDGLVELYDFVKGKLDTERFPFQSDEVMKYISHDCSIMAIAFSIDSELLAVGDREGLISVWEVKTGNCLKKILGAHNSSISALRFTKDSGNLISCSNDFSIKIHGLVSGKTLKTFDGHTSFVTDVVLINNENNLVSCSNDGYIKVWEKKSTEAIKSFIPVLPNQSNNNPIKDPVLKIEFYGETDNLFVCTRTTCMFLTDMKGNILKIYKISSLDNETFTSFTQSPFSKYLYVTSTNGNLYTFDVETSNLVNTIKAHDKEILGVCRHPFASIISTFSFDHTIKIFKP